MKKGQRISTLALEIPGKGQLPIDVAIVERYNLKPDMRSPFSGYQIVIRNPDLELKQCRCPNCKVTSLVARNEKACPICGIDFLLSEIDLLKEAPPQNLC